MKKYYFITLLVVSLNAYSQAPRAFYVTAGFSQSALESKDLLSTAGAGFMAGVDFNFGYHQTYNYQVEILYNENILNLKTTDVNLLEVKESKYKYSNIELGFYVNYYFIKPDEDKFYLGTQLGGFVSFLDPIQPSKGADVNGELYLPYLLEENDLQKTSQFNYGPGLGLTGGYNKFRFDLRYSMGFANILSGVQTDSFNDNNIYTGPILEAKTRGISFGISYEVF
ncbi:MAG: outer membrane beta-barrel protein [Flavobacterium sp.]|uniref:outer membrane beta-barrel protein n=1 Tax=Flavobacterium sp. TaxID=239 RepID=UPI0022BFC1BA|nr:outer membrane beta-barrel protein [Flavobacterium sp.]MCZ8196559.1 outer membrane beta-barrel protein [Flavobacterium sp.]